MNCKFCNSEKLVKNGCLKNKQRYLCKNCNHKFYDNGNTFVKMRNTDQVIVTSLNLYFSGLSTRKVAENIEQIYGNKISQVSIWTWIQKYTKLVGEYINSLKPELSGKYHHDETELKVGGDGRYFWETLDEDTRFIVAHMLTETRTSQEAKEVFIQSLQKQRPISFYTDGSFAYDEAFNKVFFTRYKDKKVEWVRRVGIRARETNNVVERLHGTLKDRLKPMRGLKKDETAKNFLDGYIINYNFCRKHQSLGKTPAEACGLEIKGWKNLIDKSQIIKTERELTNSVYNITRRDKQ